MSDKMLDLLAEVNSATLIVLLIVIVLFAGFVFKNWRKMRRIWREYYNRRKKEDDILQMIYDDHEDNKMLKKKMENFQSNQEKFHQQSIQIRQELVNAINEIVEHNKQQDEGNASRDAKIESLVIATRENLADKINFKYKYYISIDGIPADEVDEFTNLHEAYKGVGGNHSGDAKYNYVMKNLKVIPVESKLVFETEK